MGLACSHINNLCRKLVLTPKLFPNFRIARGTALGRLLSRSNILAPSMSEKDNSMPSSKGSSSSRVVLWMHVRPPDRQGHAWLGPQRRVGRRTEPRREECMAAATEGHVGNSVVLGMVVATATRKGSSGSSCNSNSGGGVNEINK
jgi:hypothetical protein